MNSDAMTSPSTHEQIIRLDDQTEALVAACRRDLEAEQDPVLAARQVATRLGATARAEGDRQWVEFGFWAPDLDELGVSPGDAFLEILIPKSPIELIVGEQHIDFHRRLVPMERVRHFLWAAVEGVEAGDRETVGALYWMRLRDRHGEWHTVVDHLARSVPFGPFGPAEVYDVEALQRRRGDLGWYAEQAKAPRGSAPAPRIKPPVSMMELHAPTASLGGTLASLNRRLKRVAHKVEEGAPLDPQDEVWLGYDALQLMPIHPTVVFEGGPHFFRVESEDEGFDLSAEISAVLSRPTTTNWGYDIVISACGALNPAVLETRRPDELVDLMETLHSFPGGGIKVVIDVVFGHADNQGVSLLSPYFFAGPNMYGQDLAYGHPVVRAILLEMYRRLVDFGFDGVRVDGAQDFKVWDPESQVMRHDDDFLRSMSEMVQSVAGHSYRPWMIFEDGRPWPREDWELASTYRAIIEDQRTSDPDVFQWGPLTFAHNTPFLYTFWVSKWWRVMEIVHHGSNWITGCANHDTVRRGTQLSTKLNINTRLGDTFCAIIDQAYDHPAASLLTHGILPGVPMDFLNASMRAAWGFMRNTDDRYGVKVAAEEASFLIWQVDDLSYNKVGRFRRLKGIGFEQLDDLRGFMNILAAGVEATHYDLDDIVEIIRVSSRRLNGPTITDVEMLKAVARAFMEDVHDYCNVDHYIRELDPVQTAFNLALRRFRQARPWLRRDFGAGDVFDRRWPTEGTVLYRGLRTAPDGEQVFFVANMEGAPVEIVPAALPEVRGDKEGWRLALHTPRMSFDGFDQPLTLHDNQGLLFTRAAR